MLRLARYYREYPIRVVRAFLQYVWDSEGRRYVDCNAGHGVAFLGHRHPRIVEAVKKQLDEVVAVAVNFDVDSRDEFLAEFGRIVPGGFEVVYPQNSGAEAVEVAIKVAKKATRRPTIVAFTNSFHGRTMGALSATWNPAYRRAFEPLYPHVKFLPFNSVAALEKEVPEDACCIIAELVQGEGGLNVATREFARALRDAADRVGALLIIDEIQSGMGRTGAVWSFQHYGVEPDIFTAGKALGGGLPIGVAVARKGLDVFQPGEHGSTFAANPVVMAAAAAAVRVLIDEDVPSQAASKGQLLSKALGELVDEGLAVRVRGMGLMLGLELRGRAEPVVRNLPGRGILALTSGVNVTRLLCPYQITQEDIETIIYAIRSILNNHGTQ